jgi:hypothetical protein
MPVHSRALDSFKSMAALVLMTARAAQLNQKSAGLRQELFLGSNRANHGLLRNAPGDETLKSWRQCSRFNGLAWLTSIFGAG